MSDCGGSVSDCSSSSSFSDSGALTTVALSGTSSPNRSIAEEWGDAREPTKKKVANSLVIPDKIEDWHILFDDAAYDEKKKRMIHRMMNEETMASYVADYIKGVIGVLALSVFGGFSAPVSSLMVHTFSAGIVGSEVEQEKIDHANSLGFFDFFPLLFSVFFVAFTVWSVAKYFYYQNPDNRNVWVSFTTNPVPEDKRDHHPYTLYKKIAGSVSTVDEYSYCML